MTWLSKAKNAVKSLFPDSLISTTLANSLLAQQSIKTLGYELGKQLAIQNLGPSKAIIANPIHIGLGAKCTTQADIESPWLWYWCQQLHIPVMYHRKIWELAYILQVMWENDMLKPGRRGIGFGCGQEPIPSILASRGVEITITDQDPGTAEQGGWISTAQHLGSLEQAFHAALVDRPTFDRLITVRYVDMNAINSDLEGYDFCWSTCAFEHLGSIKAGQDFVVNAMQVLKPGGLAVHTTEFNTNSDGATFESRDLVVFQQRHIEEIARRLRAQGHEPAPMDFAVGNGPIDSFIDLPPYADAMQGYMLARAEGDEVRMAHIRLSIAGLPSTCFGLWARKAL
jgi:hypothetical protein